MGFFSATHWRTSRFPPNRLTNFETFSPQLIEEFREFFFFMIHRRILLFFFFYPWPIGEFRDIFLLRINKNRWFFSPVTDLRILHFFRQPSEEFTIYFFLWLNDKFHWKWVWCVLQISLLFCDVRGVFSAYSALGISVLCHHANDVGKFLTGCFDHYTPHYMKSPNLNTFSW